jgi:hypothetical protein
MKLFFIVMLVSSRNIFILIFLLGGPTRMEGTHDNFCGTRFCVGGWVSSFGSTIVCSVWGSNGGCFFAAGAGSVPIRGPWCLAGQACCYLEVLLERQGN